MCSLEIGLVIVINNIQSIITRKPAKTNGITDEIFSSVILTDGNNSVFNSVGIYRQHNSVGDPVCIYRRHNSVGDTVGIYQRTISSVYTDRITDGLYSLFGKMQWCGDVEFFQTILPTE
jgi:hypothetical protein